MFHNEASAVAADVDTTTKIDAKLSNLRTRLEELTQLDFAVANDLRLRLMAIAPAAVGPPPAVYPTIAAKNARIKALTDIQAKLVDSERKVTTITNAINRAISDIIPAPSRVAELMEAVIRDVNGANYPDAITNLNQAIANRENEEEVEITMNKQLSEAAKLLKEQVKLVGTIRTLLSTPW